MISENSDTKFSLSWQRKQLALIKSEFDELSDLSDSSNENNQNTSDFTELDDISNNLDAFPNVCNYTM